MKLDSIEFWAPRSLTKTNRSEKKRK